MTRTRTLKEWLLFSLMFSKFVNMNVDDIKQEINIIVDQLQENIFPKALFLLKDFRKATHQELVDQIIQDDRKLLQKLADS